MQLPALKRPRCFMVYAVAPNGVPPARANQLVNEYVSDPGRGLCLYHDHFIGQPGGVAIFYAENDQHRAALQDAGPLTGWDIQVRPLIYANNPARFDNQIAYTLHAYRSADWAVLRQASYTNPADQGLAAIEAATAQEALPGAD